MPYVISPQSILTAIIRGRHENQEVMSVFTYRYNGSQELPDGEAGLEAFHVQFAGAAGLWPKWRDCVSNKVTGIRLQYQWTHLNRFAYIEKVPLIGSTGAVGGTAYPVNTAVAITKRTINSGRDQVGTLHMPGVPSTFVTDGVLTEDAMLAYAALAPEIVEAISTVTPAMEMLPVLFKESSPEVSPRITSAVVKLTARVMRRRTVGLGS